jgi:hypothetical protein
MLITDGTRVGSSSVNASFEKTPPELMAAAAT